MTDQTKSVMAPITIEASGAGGGQSSLMVVNPQEEHRRMEEAFQDILRKAPNTIIELGQSITDCLSVYNIRHAFDRLNVEKIKMFPISVLEATSAYLQIIVGSRKLDVKRVQNREDLASIIVSQIQNHLPENCMECGQTYTVPVGEERSRHCYGCGQGSHDCYKNQKSEEDQHFIQVRYRFAWDVGFVWLCTHHAKLFFDLETSVNKEAMRNLPSRKYSPLTPKPDIVDFQYTNSLTRGMNSALSPRPDIADYTYGSSVTRGMTSLRERELGYQLYDQYDRYQIAPGNTELTKQRLIDAERKRTQDIMFRAEDHRRRADDIMRRDDLQRAGEMYLRGGSERPNMSNEVCRHYKMGRCKHGTSGILNGTCPFLHPPQCLKYVTYGTNPSLGCNKGLYCENLHTETSQSYLRGLGSDLDGRMMNYSLSSSRSGRRLPEVPHIQPTDPLLVPRMQASDPYLMSHAQSMDPYLQTSCMSRSDPYLMHDPIETKQIMLQQRQDSLETAVNDICSTLKGIRTCEPRLQSSPVHMNMQQRLYATDIPPQAQVYTQRMCPQEIQPRLYSSDPLQPRGLYATAQHQQPRMLTPDLQSGMYATSTLQPRMQHSMVAPEMQQPVMYSSSLQQLPMNAAANMQHTRMAAATNMQQPMMSNVSMPMNASMQHGHAPTNMQQQISASNQQPMNVSAVQQQQQPMTGSIQQTQATNQQQMNAPRIQVQPVTPPEVQQQQQQPLQQQQQQQQQQ